MNESDIDMSKTPAELKLTESERKFGTPWRLDVVQTDPNSDTWYPYFFDRQGYPVKLESDTIKFIIECVNRFHDDEKSTNG